MDIILFHYIVNLPSGFDLLPVVKLALLPGCEIQEITSSPMRLPVIPEQIKEHSNNFEATLSSIQADYANEVFKSSYNLRLL